MLLSKIVYLSLFLNCSSQGDGRIDEDELDLILSTSLAESNISITDADYDRLVESFTAEVDTDNDGTISFEELVEQFQKYPQLLPNMALK